MIKIKCFISLLNYKKMLLKILLLNILVFVLRIQCAVNVPVWTIYSRMYSGQHDAANTTQVAGSTFNCSRALYLAGSGVSYSTPPKLILSIMGFSQNAPANGDVSVGFDSRILSVTLTTFVTSHNVYGASLSYISFMYLGIDQSMTQFKTGQYTQILTSSNQTIDVLNNVGEIYPNYGTDLIQMKGFLSGYKLQQKTTGTCVYFALNAKNSTAFTITISSQNDVVVQQVWYYRIAYDRTAIQRSTFKDVFFDFNFLLQNGTNIYSQKLITCATQNCFYFGYRNFLMGTNKIHIGIVGATQFFLQYYFSTSKSTSNPATQANPSTAQYLQGQVFLHMIHNCPNVSTPYFLQTTQQCNTACPSTNYYTNTVAGTCVDCHYSCLTCSQPFSSMACSTCDLSKRLAINNNSQCLCSIGTYDDGVNLLCVSCDVSCLTCNSANNYNCLSCNSSKHRYLNDSNGDGLGSCICDSSYYQNSSSIGGLCIKCGSGCLDCYFSGTQICISCDTINHWTLNTSSNNCQCTNNFFLNLQSCVQQVCGDGILTNNQQCDDGNSINGDGCSDLCKVQPNHACIQNATLSSYSICYYDKPIGLTITQITKSTYENSVDLKISVQANGCNSNFLNSYLTQNSSLMLQDKSRLLFSIEQKPRLLFKIKDSIRQAFANTQEQQYLQQYFPILAASLQLTITSIYYSSSENILYVTFYYDQTFLLQNKVIKFIPSSSIATFSKKYFYSTPAASANLQQSYNKIQTIYISNSEYESTIALKWAYLVLLVLFWIGCLFFIIIRKGNVGMQMMIVYQLSYLCLLSQSSVQIGFGGLAEYGKYTIGINIDMQQNNSVCKNFLTLNLNCSLLNNINITLFVMLLTVSIIFILKLYQKIKNHLAFKQFLENKIQKQYQRCINNDSQRNQSQFQNRSNSNDSKNSEKSEDYFKQTSFINPLIYEYLNQFLYFCIFITVMIWGVSLCFIKEQAGGSIAIALLGGFLYIGCWIQWFSAYNVIEISFTTSNNQIIKQSQQKVQQNKDDIGHSKFSPKALKILYYPLIWAFLLCISIVLGLSEPVGYISQSIIIAFTSLVAIFIWVFQIYSIKFQNLRSVLNCIFIISVQIVYVCSQATDSIIGTGIAVSSIVFLLLSFTLIANCGIQIYLFASQFKSKKKQEIQVQINQIVQQIQVIKDKNKRIDQQNVSQYKSAKSKQTKNPLLNNTKTIKKTSVFQQEEPEQNEQQLRAKIKLNKKQLQQLLKTKRIESLTDRDQIMNDTFRQSTVRGLKNEQKNEQEKQQNQQNLKGIILQASATPKEVIKSKALPMNNLLNYSSIVIMEQQQQI